MGYIILLQPFIILSLVIFGVLLLLAKKWRLSICFIIIAIIINFYSESFAISFFSNKGKEVNSYNSFKVLAFNIHAAGDDYCYRYEELSRLIETTNSDLVLLIEFSTQYDDYDLKFDSIIANRYPYSSKCLFTQDDNVFYSKYPIVGYDSLIIDNKGYLPLVKINVHQKSIYALGCHFCSNNYVDSIHRMDIDSVKSKMDFITYIKAIDKGYQNRKEQVNDLYHNLQSFYSSNLKNMIILGDFNDVGGSYIINKLEKLGLKDAWWEGGCGFGGTRDVGIFSFRLDHILYGSDMDLHSIKIIDANGLSDHKALCASFNLN